MDRPYSPDEQASHLPREDPEDFGCYDEGGGEGPSTMDAERDTTPSDADDLLTFLDDTFSGGHEIRFCATHEPVNDRGRTEERDGATIVWVDEPLSINEFGDTERRHECLSDALRAWYRRDGVTPSEGIAPDTPTVSQRTTANLSEENHAADAALGWMQEQRDSTIVPPSAPDTKADDRVEDTTLLTWLLTHCYYGSLVVERGDRVGVQITIEATREALREVVIEDTSVPIKTGVRPSAVVGKEDTARHNLTGGEND